MPIFILLVLGWCIAAGAQETSSSSPSVIHVDVDSTQPASAPIPRTIFGTFLEPIGNSTYNGLWAEILENPSFEGGLWDARHISKMLHDRPLLARASELGLPLPWEPLDYSQGARYEPRWNDAPNSSRTLFVAGLPEAEVGIRQTVFLPVHRIGRYVGSVYVKSLSGPQQIEVSLRRHDQPTGIIARQEIALRGQEWHKYDFVLDLPQGALQTLEPAEFVISLRNSTRVLLDQVSLMPADNISGLDPEMVAMSKAMNTPLVRFGGNFTSAYHWRDGIGPRDKRINMLNVAWGIPEYNQFGTDEFLEFCKLIGAQPQIALNLGSGTPEEAAEWVRYVNAHWADHSGGLLWELGNELWGNFQTAYPAPSELAQRTLQFSEAVRKVDPNARVIATGADPDHFTDWNRIQLSLPPGTFDYLSTHFVVTDSSILNKRATPEFAAEAAFALPVELERKLREMHAQFVADPRWRGKVNTAFTEWLFYAQGDNFPYFNNMGGAIATGGFLNMLLRNAEIVPISDMTGVIEFAGLWKKRGRIYATPAYYAFSLYSNSDVDHLVKVETHALTYDVQGGVDRLPMIAKVPYLDVVAAVNRSGEKLTFFCVNRHLTSDMAANIRIAGFRPAQAASAHSLYAESIYEVNDESEPRQIEPRIQSVKFNNGEITTVFRHESVTVLEFTRQ